MSVESFHYGVTPIHTFQHAQYPLLPWQRRRTERLDQGTGFFYQENENDYLITNRHVVIEEEENYYPNAFEIILHTSQTDIREVRVVHVPLYDSDLNPLWFEYTHLEDNFVDVVVIDLQNYLNDSDVLFRWKGNDLPSRSQILAQETQIRVLGYPFGFHDEYHNLPIAKHATIASPYGIGFENELYYLVDGNLHPGMSGSPVIIPRSALRVKDSSFIHSFLGVFSHGWKTIVNNIDMGLGTVWFPRLVREIISGQTRGVIR
jgi:hypothetical protein